MVLYLLLQQEKGDGDVDPSWIQSSTANMHSLDDFVKIHVDGSSRFPHTVIESTNATIPRTTTNVLKACWKKVFFGSHSQPHVGC